MLLSGVEGRMHALDPATALCWLSLGAPDPHAEALAALQESAGLTIQAAEAWYVAAVRQFADAALLEGTTPPPAAPPVTLPPPRADFRPMPIEDPVTLHGRLADLGFALTVPRAMAELAAGLLSPALSPAGSDRAVPNARKLSVHRVGGAYLVAGPDGVLAETAPGLDDVVALELLMVDLAARQTPHLTVLHAALLGRGATGVLITGVPGSGKTTLGATLAAAGWCYGGDERVLLSPDATTAIPLPIAPCVKAGAISTLRRWFPALLNEPDHQRYGRYVRYLKLPAAEQPPMTVRTVVFPERAAGAAPALRDIAPLDGLRRLMEQCLRVPRDFGPAELQHLLDWHDRLTYVGLRYAEAATAVPLLERLVPAA